MRRRRRPHSYSIGRGSVSAIRPGLLCSRAGARAREPSRAAFGIGLRAGLCGVVMENEEGGRQVCSVGAKRVSAP